MSTNEMLSSNDYDMAIFSQGACNLSGIANSLASVMGKIWNEARARNRGTEWANHHPICALYAVQIAWLANGDSSQNPAYNDRHEFCEAMRDGNYDKARELFPEYAPLQKETVNG